MWDGEHALPAPGGNEEGSGIESWASRVLGYCLAGVGELTASALDRSREGLLLYSATTVSPGLVLSITFAASTLSTTRASTSITATLTSSPSLTLLSIATVKLF